MRSQLRSFSSTLSTHPSAILIGRSHETDNRSRCGRSLVRCGLTSARTCPCQALWVVRSSARHQRRMQLPFLQSVLGESESIHSRTLGLWRIGRWCCRLWSSWFGFDVSVAAIRRSPNTSLPGWRSRWSKRCDTRSQRHSQRSARRNASSAEAAGGGSAANVASSMVPNYRAGQIVAGLS